MRVNNDIYIYMYNVRPRVIFEMKIVRGYSTGYYVVTRNVRFT